MNWGVLIFNHIYDWITAVAFIILVTTISLYYSNSKQSEESKKSKLQKQLSKSQLRLLQSQLQLDFLFNTLDSINSLKVTDIKKAKSMMLDLSDLLRIVMEYKDDLTIELQDELFMLRKYINIEKSKFSDQLVLKLHVQEGLENVQIPTMILQSLVEKSMILGSKSDSSPLTLEIDIRRTEDLLCTVIENNGKHFKGSVSKLMSQDLGMKKNIDRLKTIYGETYEYKMSNSRNSVKTTLKFPIKMMESELVV